MEIKKTTILLTFLTLVGCFKNNKNTTNDITNEIVREIPKNNIHFNKKHYSILQEYKDYYIIGSYLDLEKNGVGFFFEKDTLTVTDFYETNHYKVIKITAEEKDRRVTLLDIQNSLIGIYKDDNTPIKMRIYKNENSDIFKINFSDDWIEYNLNNTVGFLEKQEIDSIIIPNKNKLFKEFENEPDSIPFYYKQTNAVDLNLTYVNSHNGLNVRAQANTNSSVLTKLMFSEVLNIQDSISVAKINGISGYWLKVTPVLNPEKEGYVFSGYLSRNKKKLHKESIINEFIIEAPKNYETELKQYIEYEKEKWKNIPNPFIATYKGNYIGDYHHIEFKDDKGEIYDFGFGENDFGDILLFNKELDDNPKYLEQSFKIFWKWKISSFPCCSGDHKPAKAYLPSIVKLEKTQD